MNEFVVKKDVIKERKKNIVLYPCHLYFYFIVDK